MRKQTSPRWKLNPKNFGPNIKSIKFLGSGVKTRVSQVSGNNNFYRPEQGPHEKWAPTGHRMSDSSSTFSGLWAWGSLYGTLWHLNVHLVQHDLSGLFNASEFRNSGNIKSDSSSKAAYSSNAEFLVSFCTLMSENLCESPHIFTESGPVSLCLSVSLSAFVCLWVALPHVVSLWLLGFTYYVVHNSGCF